MLNAMRLGIPLLCGLLILNVACRGSGESASPFRQMEFSVDSSRLGSEVLAGEFSFRAPAGWDAADSTLMAAIRSGFSQPSWNEVVDMQSVYIKPASGGILMVASFEGEPTEKDGFAAWARRFVDQYRASRPQATVEEDWLKIGSTSAVQLYEADSMRVQFMYVLDAKDPIGLIYTVPRPRWQEEVHSVESSLGTIRKR